MKFCPECGSKRFPETSKFCGECGFKFVGEMEKPFPKKKIKTYLTGLDYPLEEIPAFHQICEELKLRSHIDDLDWDRILPSKVLLISRRYPQHVVSGQTLRELVLKDETSLNQFKEFLLSYVNENVNNDGTIKTWESGYAPFESNNNKNKNEILDVIETVIDITSPRTAAKQVIKMLRDEK